MNKSFPWVLSIFIVIILIQASFKSLHARDSVRLVAGYSWYESAEAVAFFRLKNDYVGIIAAHSVNISDEHTHSLNLEYIFTFSGDQRKDWMKHIFVSEKAGYMDFEDPFYRFKMINLSTTLGISWQIGEKYGFIFEAGPLFNIVTDYKRKTFEEVGWPYHVAPNVHFRFYYSI